MSIARTLTSPKSVTSVQKYSTIGPTIFLGLHFANTSVIPLVTRSIPESESYLLLTREIYQAPAFEHALLTVPVIAHVLSGTLRRILRQRRHARMFGITPGKKPTSVGFGSQDKVGYALILLLGTHVVVNRVVPLYVDGGSSSVGLGYVSYGLQKAPWFMNLGYAALIGATVCHFVGGTAFHFGWRNVLEWSGRGQISAERGKSDADSSVSANRHSRRRRRWLIASGLATTLAVTWLAGLKLIADNRSFLSWEATEWDRLYKSIPILGKYIFSS